MDDVMAVRRCTAADPNYDFCDALSVPEAPFPICVHHAAEVYNFLRGRVDDPAAQNALDASAAASVASYVARPRIDTEGYGIVYYVKIGSLLKIGVTYRRVWDRMAEYPPHRHLLAAEPGGYELEAQRLAQFAHLRVSGREWHDMAPDLRSHLASVRARHGFPQKRLDWRPEGAVDLADPNVGFAAKHADHTETPVGLPRMGSPEMDAYLDSLAPDA